MGRATDPQQNFRTASNFLKLGSMSSWHVIMACLTGMTFSGSVSNNGILTTLIDVCDQYLVHCMRTQW